MVNEELLKKIEATESAIEKLLTPNGFASFLHLTNKEEIKNVWNNTISYISSKKKSLSKDQADVLERLIENYGKQTSEISLSTQWFRWKYLQELHEESKVTHPTEASFLLSLTKNHLGRKEFILPKVAEYALKSTLPADTQRIRMARNLPITKPEASMKIEVPEYLLKNSKGQFDLAASIEKEKKEGNLRALFSAISYLPSIQERLFNEIKKSSRFPSMYLLYPDKARRAIWRGTKHLCLIASQFAYNQIERGLSPVEAFENTVEYIKTLPKNDPNMQLAYKGENLWDLIRAAFLDEEIMSARSNKVMFVDILEGLVHLCLTGLIVPDSYFEIEFRKSNEEETELEGSEFSMDLFVLDDDGIRNTLAQETYVVTYGSISLLKIMDFVTQGRINPAFYSGLKPRKFQDKLEEFINAPVSEMFIKEENENKFMEEDLLEEELINTNLSQQNGSTS